MNKLIQDFENKSPEAQDGGVHTISCPMSSCACARRWNEDTAVPLSGHMGVSLKQVANPKGNLSLNSASQGLGWEHQLCK